MKQPAHYRLLWILSFIGIWIISSVGSRIFLVPVAAQEEPTPIPTATAAPTWTPESGATSTPTLSPGQTPAPTSTPTGREVDLRPGDETIKIDTAGDCVLFTWLVKGDIDRVEWDKEDDDTDPILVSASDERQECVNEDSDFTLIARWSNGQKSQETREIRIESDSSGSGGGSGGAGGPVPTPGAFVVVTPLLITNSLAFSPPAPESSASSAGDEFRPEGILGTIVELPETGSLYQVEDDKLSQTSQAPSPYQNVESNITGKLGVLLFGIFGVTLLAKIFRQTT